MHARSILLLCVAATTWVLVAGAGAATQYDLTPLEPLAGGTESAATALNDLSQVVGYSNLAGGDYHAVLWEDGVASDLGTLVGGTESNATGINSVGQVVGYSSVAGGDYHAFLWLPAAAHGLPSGMNDLGTPAGYVHTWAMDINDLCQVVATAQTESGQSRAFLWLPAADYELPAGWNDLGSLSGQQSMAFAVNNAGQVVGAAQTEHAVWRAFLWEDGVMTDLETIGGTESIGFNLNGLGQVVGWSETRDWSAPLCRWPCHPFLWLPGAGHGLPQGMNDLGTLGGQEAMAFGVNDAGQVVGRDGTPVAGWRASLWENGVMYDLHDLTPSASGWSLQGAEEINGAGQIAGYGASGSGGRGFLLTPVEAMPLSSVERQGDGSVQLTWNGELDKTYDIYIGSRAEFPRVAPQWFVAATVPGGGATTWTDSGGATWAHPGDPSVGERYYQVVERLSGSASASPTTSGSGNVSKLGGNVRKPSRKARGPGKWRRLQ